jgi:DNA-binding response OmpR family regulator
MLILLIDDDDVVRSTVADILLSAGYKVDEARDGRLGIKLFREGPPDLVITDVLMPEMNGLEFIILLRRESPNTNILAISGGGSYGINYSRTATALGAVRMIEKPFEAGQLLDAVEDLLKPEWLA